MKGDTSTFECAHQLGALCENKRLVVNLIPYNQTDVKDKLSCPSEEHMKEFQRIVTSYGSFCSIRRTMGADIAGACGQLVVAKEKEGSTELRDIEDGPFQSKSKKKPSQSQSRNKKNHDSGSAKVEKDVVEDDNSIDVENTDKWIRPLMVATAVSASLCVLSFGMIVMQRRRKF